MDKMFEKYRKRLTLIGIFKSIVLALALALVFVGIVSSITWIVKASVVVTVALAAGIGGVIFLVAFFLLFFKHFKPTDEMIAKQLDALGFDERYITMFECKENNSVMAKLQREDAKKTLSGIPAKLLKFSVTLPIVILLVFSVMFATGTTTASIMLSSSNSTSEKPGEKPPIEETEFFTVTYKVFEEGTGRIDGELTQKVEKGHYTKEVTAVAAEGFKFVAWTDKDKNFLSNQNNPRAEVNVREDMTIFALFEEKKPDEDDDEQDGSGSGDKDPELGGGGESGQEPDDGGGQGGSGEGSPQGGESEGRQNNKVIDGNQDYKENFDREGLEKELLDKDLPDDLKDILGDYYGALKP